MLYIWGSRAKPDFLNVIGVLYIRGGDSTDKIPRKIWKSDAVYVYIYGHSLTGDLVKFP